MRALVIVVVVALGACGGSTAPTGTMAVRTSGAEISTLTRYATYTHATAERAPEGYARRAPRPELLEKVRRDVDAELQRRGYRPAEGGELVVRISTGSRTVQDQPTGRLAAAGAPETEETEGALVIDIFERASGAQLFHGFARDAIRGDKVEDEQITKAVSKILEPVPRSTAVTF